MPDVDDQLVSFSALTLLVLLICLEKVVLEMTYNVSSGTLSLCRQLSHLCWTLNTSRCRLCGRMVKDMHIRT